MINARPEKCPFRDEGGSFLQIFYSLVFIEGKEGRKRGREISMWKTLFASPNQLTWVLDQNTDVRPHQELNTQPFGWWDNFQTLVPLNPGQGCFLSLFTQENTEAYRANHFPVALSMVSNLRFKLRLHGQDTWSLITVFLSLASGRAFRLNTHPLILTPPGAPSSPAPAQQPPDERP